MHSFRAPSAALAISLLILSACARVPYGDQLPVTPDIPRDTDPTDTIVLPENAHCPALNKDPANTTATYSNTDMGISFTFPYNNHWGSSVQILPPYTEHTQSDFAPLGYVMFGPPTSGEEQGLGGSCDPVQFYELTFLPARTANEAVRTIEGRGTEVVPNTTVRKIGDLTVVQYIDAGLCSYPTFEVIGQKYNYSFTTSCGHDEEEEIAYLEDVVKRVTLSH